MQNMNGFFSDFAMQIEALKSAYTTALHKIPDSAWSFGGGTALALCYWRHRRSFDVDIFINEPQYFAFLSPKWFIDETDCFQSDYRELADHITLLTVTGIKIDFLLAPRLTRYPPVWKHIQDCACYVDAAEEIIAKKLHYRSHQAHVRDIVDLAVALTHTPDLLSAFWDDNTISLDELFAWRRQLINLNRNDYTEHLKVISPGQIYHHLAQHAPEFLLDAIERALHVVRGKEEHLK